MARLIIRIHDAAKADVDDGTPALDLLYKRCRASVCVDHDAVVKLADYCGYEVLPEFMRAPISDWPLTAVTFIEKDDGGRVSQIFRLPCRRKTS